MKFAGDTTLTGAISVFKGRAASQKDLMSGPTGTS